MDNSLFGIIIIDKKEYTYKYENVILVLNIKDDFHDYLMQNEKELPWDYLEGRIDNSATIVRFLIYKTGYGSTMKSSYYSSFSLSIIVNSYIILKKAVIEGTKTRITMSNKLGIRNKRFYLL